MTQDDRKAEISERLKEKFKDKSTRQLLDSIPPDQRQLLAGWFGGKHPREGGPPEAPAYWLSAQQASTLERLIDLDDVGGMADLIRNELVEVLRERPEIETTLFGELGNFFAGAGVPS